MSRNVDVTTSLVLLLVLVGSAKVSAIVGSLEPMDVVVEVGTDLTLSCTLDAAANGRRTAHQVVWSKYPARNVSRGRQVAVSDTLSQLTLTNLTVSDKGDYVCAFRGDGYMERLGSAIVVGRKPEPALLECFVQSPDEYWCRWQETTPTNIDNEHSFSFMYEGEWTDCPGVVRGAPSNECKVPLWYNVDIVQQVRVTSTNQLGQAVAEKQFNRETDVVVNPPRNLRLTRLESETSLRVTWSLPDGWSRPSHQSLDFKVRHMRDGCTETDSTCCCWAEEILDGASAQSLGYTLRNLDPYAVYSVQLAARYQPARQENWSKWSQEVIARTREAAPTETVQNPVVSYIVNSQDPDYRRDVHLRWTCPRVDNPRGLILGYKLVVVPDDDSEAIQEIQSTYTWSNLKDLKMFSGYEVKIAAYNSADVGQWTSVRIPDNTAGPNPPEDVQEVQVTSTSVLVEWQAPHRPNGYILDYTVEWWGINGHKWSYTTPNATQLSHLLEGLEASALYQIGVKTRNHRGESRLRMVAGGVRTLDAPSTTGAEELAKDGQYVAPRRDIILIPSAIALGILGAIAMLLWAVYHHKFSGCNLGADQKKISWNSPCHHRDGVLEGMQEKTSVLGSAEAGLQAPCQLVPITSARAPVEVAVECGSSTGPGDVTSRDSGGVALGSTSVIGLHQCKVPGS